MSEWPFGLHLDGMRSLYFLNYIDLPTGSVNFSTHERALNWTIISNLQLAIFYRRAKYGMVFIYLLCSSARNAILYMVSTFPLPGMYLHKAFQ